MLGYALTIFIGAFLLFQVQPLIGKYILPWFGGSPEVWTTCMLFFQTLLLAGYVYAHLSVRFLRPRMQAAVHLLLLVVALGMLPIAPEAGWEPKDANNPTLHILLVLTASIGLPYFVLASTSPLMQSWLARTRVGAKPYRLFALSNAGALLALGSYPLLVEPALSRGQQGLVWSLGLGLFAAASGLCAVRLWRHSKAGSKPPAQRDVTTSPLVGPVAGRRLLWLALPAGASVVLLAVTNKICLDLAAMPFLWVLPLSLYLLSFIICFDNQRWYVRRIFLIALLLSIIAVTWLRAEETNIPVQMEMGIYLAALFACCMVCHGELFRLRPAPRLLTSYYLMIAAGGAIGGFFVAVVAPLVFKTYFELYLGLVASCLFALLANPSPALRSRRWVWVGLICLVGILTMVIEVGRANADEKLLIRSRNFYGVLRLWEEYADDPDRRRYVMQHGTTIHGLQFTDPSRRRRPTAYYGPGSGAGLTMRFFPRKAPRRIGIIGLGVGTLAAYGATGDVFRFYEINPAVKRLAETHFTYLADSPARTEVIMGDARLSLQREPPQQFDMLFLDAFTSDAIPVHLLTVEAFDIYLKHLKPDGVLAVHISTYHLDLELVILKLAEHFRLQTAWIGSDDNEQEGILSCDWILLTNNEEFLNVEQIQHAARAPKADFHRIRLWTDDHVNLLEILR